MRLAVERKQEVRTLLNCPVVHGRQSSLRMVHSIRQARLPGLAHLDDGSTTSHAYRYCRMHMLTVSAIESIDMPCLCRRATIDTSFVMAIRQARHVYAYI